MINLRREKASYSLSNKVRSILLLLSNEEIKNIKKNCYTKVNSVSFKEKVQMSEDIEIRLDNSFTGNMINLHPKQTKSSIIHNLPIKLQGMYISRHKGENSIYGIECKKLKKYRFSSLKNNLKKEASNKLFYKKFKSLSNTPEKRILFYSSSNNYDRIINFLNSEKAFFENPVTYQRAEKSFYYLQELCDLYKFRENNKDQLGFEEIINMMEWKEGLDESHSKGKKSLTGNIIGKKGLFNPSIKKQNSLHKCIKGDTNANFKLFENLKGNFKKNEKNRQNKKNSVPCVETGKKMKKKISDLIKLLKCQADDISLSDTFPSDKSEISVSSSFLSEVSKESDSSKEKAKEVGKKKKVRRSNPTAKIIGNPFKIQLINCENSVKIREFKYLNS